MKYIYMLLVTLLFANGLEAQNCNFTYSPILPNTLIFAPPASFPTGSYYFTWDFGDGSSITTPNPTHTYLTQGTYTVTLNVIDAFLGTTICTTTTQVTLTFCDAGFTQNAGNPSTFDFWANLAGGNFALWNFGDNTAANGALVSHTYTTTGNYNVTMTQYDTSSSAAVCTRIFHVSYNLTGNCAFTATQPDPVNAPNVIEVNAFVASSTGTVTWDFGDQTLPVSGYTVQKAYASAGVYTICMTYINGTDTCVTCQTVTINIAPPPCSFVAVPSVGNPDEYTFTASSSNTGTYFHWNYNDGMFDNGNSVTHIYTVPGTYLVCMQEIDSATSIILCSYCQPVTIGSSFLCSFTYNAAPANPLDIMFSTNFNSGFTYSWDFGDATTDTGTVVNHIYSGIGVYSVCLSVYQGATLVCSNCQQVTVGGNGICQANFTSVSIGLMAYFVDQSSSGGGAGAGYNWNFGDGNTSSLQFPQHQYSLPGTYTVCLSLSTASNCNSTYCSTIVIDTTIVNPVGCNAYFVFTQTAPYQLVAVNLSSGNNINFSWDFGDNTPPVSGAYPTHQYTSTGSYVICLTVSDFFGCSDTYCDSLSVDTAGNIMYRNATVGFVLNVISPADLTSSVHENQQLNLTALYPVPASDKLTIQWTSAISKNISYSVIDAVGKEVMHGNLTKAIEELNISNLSPGIYLLRANDEGGFSANRTFIRK
ncbi:MAG: PKD domain-containing protein [Bacteroidota bacterium]